MKLFYCFKWAFIALISMLCCDVNGQNLGWAHKIGSTGDEYPRDMAVDAQGNVIIAGTFENTIDFDPGSGTANLTSNGSRDIFIQKLSNSGSYIWATHIGNDNGEFHHSLELDNLGNIYLTGAFDDTVDFDPGISVSNLIDTGINAQYICKLNSSGNLVWVKMNGGIARTDGYGINLDNSGNVLTTGNFQNTSDFDPDTSSLILTANASDVFVQKLSPLGDLKWAHSFGGSQNDFGYDVGSDAQGNVYVTGIFAGTVDFDPDTSTFNLTSGGSFDVFVAKFDSSGNFIWSKNFSGTGYDIVNSMVVDSAGNSYTTGYFRNTVDFDPGSGTQNLTASGNYDIFLTKLDASGNLSWVIPISSSGSNIGVDVRLDDAGFVYLTGIFNGTADFDPSADTFNLASTSSGDAFAAKYTSNQNFVWARSLPGSTIGLGSAIDSDDAGDVYMTGRFGGTVDFDPGPGVYNLTTSGGIDGFIMKFCTVSFDSVFQTECDSFISPSGLYVWDSSGIYFDTLMASNGCDSILTVDLTIFESALTLISPTACDSFLSPSGNVLSSSGLYFDTLATSNGCDSVIRIDLTINPSYSGSMTVVACDSFISPGGNQVWFMSGLYNDTLATVTGCDSIISVNLTINQSQSSALSLSACDSIVSPSGNYVWNSSGLYYDTLQTAAGCDSILLISVDIRNSAFNLISLNACDSVISPSGKFIWIESGTYYDTLNTSSGCDSVLEISLTITTIDISVVNNDPELSSNQNGASYQWIDCDNDNLPLNGETGQSFTAIENGLYAVIIELNSCVDTSLCEEVISLSLGKEIDLQDLKIYPNPVEDELTIDFNRLTSKAEITIRDNSGKEVIMASCESCESIQLDFEQDTGLYFIEVRTDLGRRIIRVVKN